jgi:hypothetical protein
VGLVVSARWSMDRNAAGMALRPHPQPVIEIAFRPRSSGGMSMRLRVPNVRAGSPGISFKLESGAATNDPRSGRSACQVETVSEARSSGLPYGAKINSRSSTNPGSSGSRGTAAGLAWISGSRPGRWISTFRLCGSTSTAIFAPLAI